MCGICGIARMDGTGIPDAATLQRMTDIMAHRGPDSSGFYRGQGIGLGFRRLSIIDLKTGDQPVSNEDGTIQVVCNGEIYNYLELRQELRAAGHVFRTDSDTEVIAHLYEDHGAGFLQRLRGMFGLALWDKRSRSLLLARDRLGIKPLYYATARGTLYFASEQKSILTVEEIGRQPDFTAMRALFEYGFVAGSHTLCRGILRLSPGYYLLLRQGAVATRKYWDVSFPQQHSGSMSVDDWAEALAGKLEESVRLHMRSDVAVGALLSGGIDSSGVVSLMSRLSNKPVKTFSIAFEDPASDEVRKRPTLDRFPGYGITNERILCRARDLELLPKAIWHVEDPSASGIEILHIMLSELCSRSVKVVLTGEGADEVFGAYGWFHADKLLRPFSFLPLPVRRLMLLGPLLPRFQPVASRVLVAPRTMNGERYRAMIAPAPQEFLHQVVSPETREYLEKAADLGDIASPDEFHQWHPFNRLQYYEMKVRLPGFVTRIMDHALMSHSIEGRPPFLDHELVEFCAAIPPSLKMKWFKEKYVLRKALRPYLPDEILRRNKWGLRAPLAQWLRGKLPEFARELLSERSVREKGYFRPDAVARLMETSARSPGEPDRRLMRVLVIQLWDEIFIRGRQLRSAASLGAPASRLMPNTF